MIPFARVNSVSPCKFAICGHFVSSIYILSFFWLALIYGRFTVLSWRTPSFSLFRFAFCAFWYAFRGFWHIFGRFFGWLVIAPKEHSRSSTEIIFAIPATLRINIAPAAKGTFARNGRKNLCWHIKTILNIPVRAIVPLPISDCLQEQSDQSA